MADEPEVVLYTDGACSGNPGPGGWAFVMRHLPSGKELERSGGDADTGGMGGEGEGDLWDLKRLTAEDDNSKAAATKISLYYIMNQKKELKV